MELTGKWRYTENYEKGRTEGELSLKQEGEKLSGRLVFKDLSDEKHPFMIQEVVEGTIDGIKIRLNAVEYDIIYADTEFDYELDDWFGLVLDENTIMGISSDTQAVNGKFELTRIKEQ